MYTTLDNTRKPVTLLLKGPAGSGKTTKAAQFPAPVLFNFDNNLSGLRKLPAEVRSGIRVVSPRNDDAGKAVKPELVWANFVRQLERVMADATVKTVILDSMTTLVEALMDKVLGSGDPNKKIEIQHWGEVNRYLKWLGEHLLCANDLDKTVIFIAHEQAESAADGAVVKLVLNFGGKKLNRSYDLYFTDCWRCFTKVSGTDVKYCVRTVPDSLYDAKCSLVVPPVFEWDAERANIFKQLESGGAK